jgi:hypothetical protein
MELSFFNEIKKHEIAQASRINQDSGFYASYLSRYYQRSD